MLIGLLLSPGRPMRLTLLREASADRQTKRIQSATQLAMRRNHGNDRRNPNRRIGRSVRNNPATHSKITGAAPADAEHSEEAKAETLPKKSCKNVYRNNCRAGDRLDAMRRFNPSGQVRVNGVVVTNSARKPIRCAIEWRCRPRRETFRHAFYLLMHSLGCGFPLGRSGRPSHVAEFFGRCF